MRPARERRVQKESFVSNVTLIDALLSRRSRRFGQGMRLETGPLAFTSPRAPSSLTLDDEALLAFAAVGITGPALGEMEYTSGTATAGGGNILAGFVGRTAASADALQSVGLVVISDSGTWYIPRPQDLRDPAALPELLELARERQFTKWYERIRVPITSTRVTIPPVMPFTPAFNRWDSNQPGTTVFLPIIETTGLFLNCLLTALSEEMGIFIIDDGLDDKGVAFQPAGLEKFARANGGHLRSDQKEIGFVVPLTLFEAILLQSVSAEMGGILQNLGLMAQALGLGGFTHAAQHPIWLAQLGFVDTPAGFQDMMGVGAVPPPTLESMGYAGGVPTFTSQGRLMRSFCPPDYPTMSAAVDDFVDLKYGNGGVFRGGDTTAWKNPRAIEAGIQPYSANAIAATKAYCEYVFGRYKRFPTLSGPISTLLAYQAHRPDADFYDQFYKPGVLP
jgi:hypothetical protein